jgi:hypothetical protein
MEYPDLSVKYLSLGLRIKAEQVPRSAKTKDLSLCEGLAAERSPAAMVSSRDYRTMSGVAPAIVA